MKILKITAEGLPLFKEPLNLTFYATQNVTATNNECVADLFSNIYSNNIEMFAGINASGKTTVLHVLLLVLDILENKPINQSPHRFVLGSAKDVVINTYYYVKNESQRGSVCRLKTIISYKNDGIQGINYYISKEEYWQKPISQIRSKKDLTDYTGLKPEVRGDYEKYLANDVSIILTFNNLFQTKIQYLDLMEITDNNILKIKGDIPAQLIRFLDPSIEYISIQDSTDDNPNNVTVIIKYYNGKGCYINNIKELNRYLSSGTIKGITVFRYAEYILKTGGYLIIDELENHFNKEIVSILMGFFTDKRINKYGATLVFSTHYPDLLDNVSRNDCIYIMRNKGGITAQNLTEILKRNDIKRSEAYQSDLMKGTAPSYDAYISYKKALIDFMK